jgi:hypothetical protein
MRDAYFEVQNLKTFASLRTKAEPGLHENKKCERDRDEQETYRGQDKRWLNRNNTFRCASCQVEAWMAVQNFVRQAIQYGMGPRPRIRAALIDLSGTLFTGSSPTQDAVDALKRLRAVDLPIRFCSNSSKESTAAVCNRMRKIGFELSADSEVWTSLGATSRLLQLRGLKKYAYIYM